MLTSLSHRKRNHLDDLLYKGPDIEVQLRKIGESATRLPEISALANEKKWSVIQGIITVRYQTVLV